MFVAQPNPAHPVSAAEESGSGRRKDVLFLSWKEMCMSEKLEKNIRGFSQPCVSLLESTSARRLVSD